MKLKVVGKKCVKVCLKVKFGTIDFPYFHERFVSSLKQENLFNYSDDSSVSVNHMEIHDLSRLLQAVAEVTVKWCPENAMQANLPNFKVLR